MSDEELLVHINYLREDIHGLKATVDKNTDAIWKRLDEHSSDIKDLSSTVGGLNKTSAFSSNLIAGVVAAVTSALVSLGVKR